MKLSSLGRLTAHAAPRASLMPGKTLVAWLMLVGLLVITPPAVGAQTKRATPGQAPATRKATASATQKTQAAAVRYSCPMHPEVVSDAAGRCPKCGMTLRAVSAKDEAKAPAESSPAAPSGGAGASAKMAIPDVELLNQDGERIHFYRDLVKGKTVAINFIFTTCTTICPPLGATFARLQRDLGERAGRDVHFISISVDPLTDTPERLKAWGAKFHAGRGWTFVTGEKQQVDELLRALSAATANPQDHSPTVLIGNDARGEWTRAYGLSRPSQLIAIINQMLGEAGAPAASSAPR